MTDKDKDRIKCAIRHIKSSVDVDPWAMEIAVDAMLRMLNADDDHISRRAAIDALNDEYHGMISDESMKIYQIIKWLEELPSAQPKTAGRCINCKHRYDGDCPMRFEEIVEIDDDGYIDHDVIYHDFTRDDGYCDRWERRTDE